jgi:hypothetical protein
MDESPAGIEGVGSVYLEIWLSNFVCGIFINKQFTYIKQLSRTMHEEHKKNRCIAESKPFTGLVFGRIKQVLFFSGELCGFV